MSKRLIFIATLFALCTAGSYYLFKPSPLSQADAALAHLKEGNYAAADEALRHLSGQSLPSPLALYRGYLELARGRYLESNLYLSSLFKDPSKRVRDEIATEVLLAQAINAYFEQRDSAFASCVERASTLSAHNPFVSFFGGLDHYREGDFKEALKGWSSLNFGKEGDVSGWLGVVIEKFFPRTWRELHIAHCLTETGDPLRGREILEKESHESENRELTGLATLFLGLTYLKEGAHVPLDQRGSYYKLARFYFERGGVCDTCEQERKLLALAVESEAERLILSDLDEERLKWGFDFIHTLQGWRADQAIESLAQKLAEKMLLQKESEGLALCQLIRQEFLGSPFHLLVTQKLLDAMAYNLKRGETDDLYDVWSKVEALSPSPKSLTKQIAQLTSAEIFRTIKQDSKSLLHTRRYLDFWERLGRSSHERDLLAKDLMMHAQIFWLQEHQEKKGERLMELALKFSENRSAMEGEISSFLTTLYTLAEQSNLIDRLMVIFDAMDHFQIRSPELVTPSKTANHLADADYLYHAHNYSHCKAHAMWVLKLDPENTRAQRLLGLSSFHLGDYSRAFIALSKLDDLDDDARKALMLSQVFASQEQERHLCQFDSLDKD